MRIRVGGQRHMERKSPTPLFLNVRVAVAMTIAGVGTSWVFYPDAVPAPIWPPAGIAFAALYGYGVVAIPGVLLGALVPTAYAFSQLSPNGQVNTVLVILVGCGAALQALVSMLLTRRFVGKENPLTQPSKIVRFMVLAGAIGPLVNSTLGTTSLWGAGNVTTADFAHTWTTWWLGDAMGVVFFAPIVLMVLPSQRDAWVRRRLKVAVPTLIAVVLTLAVWSQQVADVREEALLVASQRAHVASGQLGYHASTYLRVAKDAASLFLTTAEVSPQAFSAFTRQVLLEEPEVLALEWLPSVPVAERSAFERQQQDILNLPSFRVWQLTEGVSSTDFSRLQQLTPILFAATQPGYTPSFGLDLSSSRLDAPAMQDALRDGASMTQPFTTTYGVSAVRVVRLIVPVYGSDSGSEPDAGTGARHRGFVTVILAVDELVEDTFETEDWADAKMRVIDVQDPAAPLAIAVRERETREPSAVGASSITTIADRKWKVVLWPGARTSSHNGVIGSQWILLLGLLIAGLLESLMLVVTGLQRRLERRVRSSDHAARHDPLTDLANRRAFVYSIEAARQAVNEVDTMHVLMAIDLDGFKSVNDKGGHATGDQLLRAVATAMREQVRQGDVAARLGGDEFAVLLRNCPTDRGLEIASNILQAISAVRVLAGEIEFGVTASIGVLFFEPGDPADVVELLARADDACYEAKRAGKSQVKSYLRA